MNKAILSSLSPEYPWKDRLFVYPELDSTNNRLKQMASEGARHGTVLIADRQTGGRGRMGRTFLSPAGVGVYLSILLRPDCRPTELMHLTCATAAAMCRAIESAAGISPGIKWTNDIVWDKRKLAGILTEMGLNTAGGADWAIIGIGVNCCQAEQDFAPEIRDKACSLAMAAGHEIHRCRMAAAMMEALWRMDASLLTGKEEMLRFYRSRCVTLGKEISVVKGEEIRHGKALDVDGDGALVVRFSDGRTEAVSSGEVSIRGMYGYL